MSVCGLLEHRTRSTNIWKMFSNRTAQLIIYFILAINFGEGVSKKYVEPYGDNVCSRVTSVTNVQRIPMSGIQTKKFRYMTKCSVFGVAMCSRYRLVYVNAFRELVSTQYAVRPGCCKGYIQEGTVCYEAPPTTIPPLTSTQNPSTIRAQTVRASVNGGVASRGSSSGYPIKDGSGSSKGQSGHHDEVLIDQEGGYFEVNPDYKGPAVDRVLPLIASGVAAVITLTAVVAFILIVMNRRKRRRNKVQPGFHDSVQFRTNNQPKTATLTKLEMKRMSTEKTSAHVLALAAPKPNTKPSKKVKKFSRKDGPYVEISDIPGTHFARVTSKTEEMLRESMKNNQVHNSFINNRRSLNESQRKQNSPLKRGGSLKCVPQYAVVNKLRRPDKDCEKLLGKNKKKLKNNNDLEDSLHGAYHAFTLEHQDTAGDSAPVYADPITKAQNKSRTWGHRAGTNIKENPRAVGTLTPGSVLALVKQSNLRETSKLFTNSSSGGKSNRRQSSGYSNNEDSENSSGYSSLRHSVEGDPDMYGKLNHATNTKPSGTDVKSQIAALEACDDNDYDKLRRGPKSRTLGVKWATSGHYETLDVDES